jgi:membrane protein DedA with SNARE-associated domain
VAFEYFLVFIGTLLVDLFPFPLPPAFVVMVFLQMKYDLNIWYVLIIGVAGSITGRYLLALYVPHVSDRIFKKEKNEDVKYLGKKLKQKGWKSQLSIFVYSLMPLPTTPLFIAGGMARMKPYYMIPPFAAGKIISDFIAVSMGKYAAENTDDLLHGLVSWKSILGLTIGLLLIFILIFIDWKKLLIEKKVTLRLNVFKRKKSS